MKLYDAYGREVDTARLRGEQAAPTMTGVRNIYSLDASVGRAHARTTDAIQREAEVGDPFSTSNSPKRWKRRTCITWP